MGYGWFASGKNDVVLVMQEGEIGRKQVHTVMCWLLTSAERQVMANGLDSGGLFSGVILPVG